VKLSKQKQKQFILTLAITVGAAVATWYFLIKYLTQKRDAGEKELKTMTEKVKTLSDTITQEIENRSVAKDYQKFIGDAEDLMPKGSTETWLLKEINKLAAQHKINISNSALQEVKELSDFKFAGQPYKLAGLRFEFKADLNQIGKFIADIENNRQLMEVDDLSITSGSELGPDFHTVSMRISMVTKL
jgi:hypothetical protein